MKVYYINLDRSPERRAWFTKQAEALGLDLVRVPAVDGRELPAAELDRWRQLSEGNKILSPGEIGCFLSHRKAWEMVLAGQEKWAFIAEDDIHFSERTKIFFQDIIWLPRNTDLVKAETDLRRHQFSRKYLPLTGPYNLRKLHSNHLNAGGYFISKNSCKILLSYTENKCEAVDGLLFAKIFMKEHKLKIYQLDPAICIQSRFLDEFDGILSFSSDLEKDRIKYRKILKNEVSLFLNKIYREINRIFNQIENFYIILFSVIFRISVYKSIEFYSDNNIKRKK
ncbi:glycosyltransferase family 25 protein [Aquamicrobium sp. NLF2-7]|uniref:glycosyltransferase family 25 protein n=1 Tax=Aquamicrobium sp. NLF2-7 TaxID=2918753 RepID=UPI001EFB10E7|nr:glycosyltransferase family 25 protein [Aquamicrobium sp. NLF2-7]MCG8271051.1 glycosyltransferase family 25 protein [Aquamicrobium sp. NLF2-7]